MKSTPKPIMISTFVVTGYRRSIASAAEGMLSRKATLRRRSRDPPAKATPSTAARLARQPSLRTFARGRELQPQAYRHSRFRTKAAGGDGSRLAGTSRRAPRLILSSKPINHPKSPTQTSDIPYWACLKRWITIPRADQLLSKKSSPQNVAGRFSIERIHHHRRQVRRKEIELGIRNQSVVRSFPSFRPM
jgi:hypothetical protein